MLLGGQKSASAWFLFGCKGNASGVQPIYETVSIGELHAKGYALISSFEPASLSQCRSDLGTILPF